MVTISAARIKIGIGVVLLGLLPVGAFYGLMMTLAHRETFRAGLPGVARNSILHAYAGAETYWWLRRAGLNGPFAERVTIKLGYLNEWAEAIVKWPRDTTREAYKDLQNNFIGVVAMRSFENCSAMRVAVHRRSLISTLAANRAILWRSDDPRVPESLPKPLDVRLAVQQFKMDRKSIEQSAIAAIRNLPAVCST